MGTSRISQETLASAKAVGQQATVYTDSTPFERCAGNAAVIIISTAGSITVTQQCSSDNVNWYDPLDTAGSALGGIRAALTVTTGTYTPFTPVLTPYIRFKVVEQNSAATVLTLKLIYRSEV